MAIVWTRTGDILAMANVDGETADSPAKPASSTEQNRTVTDVFEPGSTNKVVTIAAALEAGVVMPDTVTPTPSALMIDGVRFEDVETHPSEMTVADILRESSNVGTISRGTGVVRRAGATSASAVTGPTSKRPGIILPL
jgi:cell division protein FtsI (penicillin-binding protein 3)